MATDSPEKDNLGLIEAAQGNKLDEVIRLLDSGANIDAHGASGQTAISWAAALGYFDVMKTLCERGASLEITDQNGLTPADFAARAGRYKFLSYFLSLEQTTSIKHCRGRGVLFLATYGSPLDIERFAAPDPNPRDNDGKTPLIDAASRGRDDAVSVLLRLGADPLLEDNRHRTALYYAAEGGHIPVIHALLDVGVDPNNLGSCSSEPSESDHGSQALLPGLWAALSETEKWTALLASKPDLSIRDGNGKTALHHAVIHGRTTAVERLLAAGSDVDAWDSDGTTPLIHASMRGHLSTVEILLQAGADAKLAEDSHFKETALQWAVQTGHSDVAKLLCPKSDVDARGYRGRTAMIWAAQSGDIASVQALLAAKANLSIVDDDYGQSALSWAAESGALPVVALLIRAGADLYTVESHGKTPISFALHDLDMVKAFIEEPRGTVEMEHEPTPRVRAAELALRYSCENLSTRDIDHPRAESASSHREGKDESSRHSLVPNFILSQREYLKQSDQNGRTLLSWAAESGYPEEIKWLCEAEDMEVDINTADIEKRTLLHWAAGSGSLDVVKCLWQHGATASLDRLDSTQQTPLFKAASQGHLKIMSFLLTEGASADRADRGGRTVLSVVAEGGYLDCVELLLDQGWPPDIPDHQRRTPLSWAAEMGHAEVVKVLLQLSEGKTENKSVKKPRQVKKVRFKLEGDDDEGPGVAETQTSKPARATSKRGLGVEVNLQDMIQNWTPLWYAAMNLQLAAFESLLEGGANPSTTDASDKTLQEKLEEKQAEVRVDAEADHATLKKLSTMLEKLMSSAYLWAEPAADATVADKKFHATFLYIPEKDMQHLGVARKVLSLDRVLRGKRPSAPHGMSCAWVHLPANNVSAQLRTRS